MKILDRATPAYAPRLRDCRENHAKQLEITRPSTVWAIRKVGGHVGTSITGARCAERPGGL